MCGIFGVGFLERKPKKEEIIALLKQFGRYTQHYGNQASGVAVLTPKRSVIIKHGVDMPSLLDRESTVQLLNDVLSPEGVNDERSISTLIGHCRFPTKGTIANNKNNHPFRIGHIIGMHAGCLQNDDKLFKDYEDQFKRIAQVDSEIIFQLIEHYRKTNLTVEAIKLATAKIEGSFACAVLNDTETSKLYLFRRNTRLNVRMYYNLGMIVFSTDYAAITSKAIRDVFGPSKERESQDIPITNDEGIVFDIDNSVFSRFSLSKENFVGYH